jgi:hypothetical protein
MVKTLAGAAENCKIDEVVQPDRLDPMDICRTQLTMWIKRRQPMI